MDSEQQNLLMELVNDLVNGRYDEILTTQRNGRLSEAEITRALTDYPGTLTLPPKTFLSKAYYYPREGEEELFGSGDVALWYNNEASDLSLIFDFSKVEGRWKITIDDIRVL